LEPREALVRIQRIFENEKTWKGLAPEHIKTLRDERTRPLLDAYFTWAELEYAKVEPICRERGISIPLQRSFPRPSTRHPTRVGWIAAPRIFGIVSMQRAGAQRIHVQRPVNDAVSKLR